MAYSRRTFCCGELDRRLLTSTARGRADTRTRAKADDRSRGLSEARWQCHLRPWIRIRCT
jgi:hypothetical protein